jgi:hypothetical protein
MIFQTDTWRRQENVMKEAIEEARDESKDRCSERGRTEERFLEQFAALEESLAVLQANMHNMSENANLFGRLARQIRRSTCPTTDHGDEIRC